MNEYYTYAYLREDKTPYYIGKGKCKTQRHLHPGHYTPIPPKERILILKNNITEEEAFKHEKYMIAVFGRKDLGTGILRNLTDGGNGKSGWKMNENTKEKIRISNFGQKRTEETKRKLSEVNKGNIPWIFGKKHTPETREKIRQAHLGKPFCGNHNNHKNSKWWNNGQINKRSVECPSDGWQPGRLKLKPYNRRK
jgi:hypothetical protein